MLKNKLFTLIFLQIYIFALTSSQASGPYHSIPVSCNRCKKPLRPYERNPSVVFVTELYMAKPGVARLRGNLTVLKSKSHKGVKLKSRRYKYEDGRWSLKYMMHSMGCRGLMISSILFVFGIEYDKNECILSKGIYNYSNVDTNRIEHLWYSRREYELAKWQSEIFSSRGTLICVEFVTWVVRARD